MRLWRWFLSLLKPSTKGLDPRVLEEERCHQLDARAAAAKTPSDAGVASRFPIPYP